MYSLSPFHIDLKALGEGEQTFTFKLDDEYFKAIDAHEVQRGNLEAHLAVERAGNYFELHIHVKGNVSVPCDICLEDMDLPIEANQRMVVKLGETYSEEDDLVTIDEDDGIFDVSWLVYELIALHIPVRHIHEAGKCNPVMLEKLKELSMDHGGAEHEKEEVDPRWEALAKLRRKD